ncbi:MAG: hypothetical protein ICV87_08340 [Gemmatimonadetes bacterium]|nr:hypothetical protein [Gemmatimonadota bacterium]
MGTTCLALCSLEQSRDRRQAEQWGRKSLAIHTLSGDLAGIGRAYAHLAELDAAWGDRGSAAELARASLRAFAARGQMNQAVVRRELERIQGALGSEWFSTAWQEVVFDPALPQQTAYIAGAPPAGPAPSGGPAPQPAPGVPESGGEPGTGPE